MRPIDLLMVLALTAPLGAAGAATPPEMARIPAGSYTPLFVNGERVVQVKGFALDRVPVTRADYMNFLAANPRWRPGRAPRALAGERYLAWTGPAETAAGVARPATEISWFAARAYCAWRGKRLPSTDEWEYAASANEHRRDASRDRGFIARLLRLYTTRSAAQGGVGATFRNAYGVSDMHGLVWEWTEDFGSVLISDDSRATSGRDHQLFCAAGVIGATDPSNYAAFLRYGVRAALEGRTTTGSLGFRCAQDV